jgi:hypothetical protein
MESRELPKRIFKAFSSNNDRGFVENRVQDLLNQGYRIESMTADESDLFLYLTLDPNAVQPADPKS